MAYTNTTTYTSTIQTRWRKDLLKISSGRMVSDKYAVTDAQEKGNDTVRVNKILRPAKQTTASSEGTLYTPADAKALTSNYIDFNLEIFGDSFGFTDKEDIVSLITKDKNKMVIGDQMADSLDWQVMKKLATQGMRHRIDADGTYQVSGTVDSGSTTTLVDNALTQADDFWNGGYVTSTSPFGTNYDVTKAITDFVASTDTVTHGAFNQANDTSTKYRMTVGTGLAASDVMSSAGILAIAGLHEKVETEAFDGGLYRMFIDPAQHVDLWSDTDFKNSATYDSWERFQRFKVVRWFDHEMIITSNIYREDVDGTQNDAGVVYVSPSFGKNAYTVISYANQGGSGKFAVKFYVVDQPDSQNLRGSAQWLSWKGAYAAGVLRATSVINLMTGATSQNVLV